MTGDIDSDRRIALRALEVVVPLFLAGPVLIAAVRLARRRRRADAPGRRKKEALFVRYATLVVLTFVLLGSAYLGPVPFAGLVLAIVLIGLAEFRDALRACRIAPYAPLGLAAGAGLVLSAAFLIYIRSQPNGFGRLLFTQAVIQFGDIFALLGGMAVGGPRLAPSLSPGKTWAGALTGLGAAFGAAWLFRFCVPELGLAETVGLAALLTLSGMLGGLVASSVKRAGGLKDFGRVLPGHGGVLDRFDSTLASAPVAWLFFVIAGGAVEA